MSEWSVFTISLRKNAEIKKKKTKKKQEDQMFEAVCMKILKTSLNKIKFEYKNNIVKWF